MKKQIDPEKFLACIAAMIENMKSLEEKDKSVTGKYYFSTIESSLYGVMRSIEASTVDCEEKAPEPESKTPSAGCYDSISPINEEHAWLLKMASECEKSVKCAVSMAFCTDKKALPAGFRRDEIPMLKEFIAKKILESKELDAKIAEIENGAAK